MKDDDKTTLARLAVIAALMLAITLIASIIFARSASAQGIYMGRDGRAHPSVIVGADGGIFPVVPTFCYGGAPCPVILAPPLPFRHPQFAPPPPPLPPLEYQK
jgi:hypothetical protein